MDQESYQHSNIEEGEMAQLHGAIHFHENAVNRVRARIGQGVSLSHCEECGEAIPEQRRQAVAGCRTCIVCQALKEQG